MHPLCKAADTMPPSHPTSYPSPGVWWYLNKTHPWSHLLPNDSTAQLTAIHSRPWVLFETYFCPGEICDCPNCHWKPQPQDPRGSPPGYSVLIPSHGSRCSDVFSVHWWSMDPWCIKIWCSETSPELWKIRCIAKRCCQRQLRLGSCSPLTHGFQEKNRREAEECSMAKGLSQTMGCFSQVALAQALCTELGVPPAGTASRKLSGEGSSCSHHQSLAGNLPDTNGSQFCNRNFEIHFIYFRLFQMLLQLHSVSFLCSPGVPLGPLWQHQESHGITISPSAPVLGAATAASPKCRVPWQRGADAQTGAPARRKFQQKCQKMSERIERKLKEIWKG